VDVHQVIDRHAPAAQERAPVGSQEHRRTTVDLGLKARAKSVVFESTGAVRRLGGQCM
jgi:hypothetical protein